MAALAALLRFAAASMRSATCSGRSAGRPITAGADFRAAPGPSLAYGLFPLTLSPAVQGALHAAGLLHMAPPAVAGFLIVAPFLALGLHVRSRARMERRAIDLRGMVRAQSTRCAVHAMTTSGSAIIRSPSSWQAIETTPVAMTSAK